MTSFKQQNDGEHTLQFRCEDKVFVNDEGQEVNYTARYIVIDGIDYKVASKDARVFDLQFGSELSE